MGLFGTSKIKTTPNVFVKFELDKIFSTMFDKEETDRLDNILRNLNNKLVIDRNQFMSEIKNAVCNLFQVAWCKGVNHNMFINYGSLITDDPRVKTIYTDAYHMCLSRAQEAGMSTFAYVASVFLKQILRTTENINKNDYDKMYIAFGTYFTDLFIYYENAIKKYKFITP
jgi:hypothetical protein